MSDRVPATIAWAMPSTSWSRFRRLASSEIARRRSVIDLVEFGQPGVADRGRHVVGESAGELGLIGRPRVVAEVVEDEQPERHVAEHDRDVADRADAGPSIDLPQPGQRGREIAAQDLDLLFAEGVHPKRLGIPRERVDELEDLLRQAALRYRAQRGR